MKCTDCKLLANFFDLAHDRGFCHAPMGRGRQRLFGGTIHGLQTERQCTYFIHKDSAAKGWEYPKEEHGIRRYL